MPNLYFFQALNISTSGERQEYPGHSNHDSSSDITDFVVMFSELYIPVAPQDLYFETFFVIPLWSEHFGVNN